MSVMRPHPGDKVRITPGTGRQKQQLACNFVTDTCDCTSAFGKEGNSFIFENRAAVSNEVCNGSLMGKLTVSWGSECCTWLTYVMR